MIFFQVSWFENKLFKCLNCLDRLKKCSKQVFHHNIWKLDWGTTTFVLFGINFSIKLEHITELNYNFILPKIKLLIQQWNRRILKLIDQVTIVETLFFFLPKLNHFFKFTPLTKMKKINSQFKDLLEFIWKSNFDKVKRVVSQN